MKGKVVRGRGGGRVVFGGGKGAIDEVGRIAS